MFPLKLVAAAEMTEQLTRFVPLLFRAAGYSGWCILLDELELIGRYTPLQRALAYAWLANWLGLSGSRRVPGIVAVYAITDDFATAVINARRIRPKRRGRDDRCPADRLRSSARSASCRSVSSVGSY